MLSAIVEAPVASLDETHSDAQLALRLLRQESRAVQAEGWHWNTDENYKLLPNTAGEIVLPLGTLKVDTVGDSATLDLTNRGGKLYDRQNRTFTLSVPVFVDIVQQLEFETIPESARQYIKVRAGRKFIQRTVGQSDAVGYAARDEKDARGSMEEEEEANADRSIFQNPEYARLMRVRRPLLWP